MSTTNRRRIVQRVILCVLGVVVSFGPGVARAAELGDTVWIPMVDPNKGVEETFELNTLGMIRSGDDGDADWRIFRGKYRESVSRRDFFVTVGRPDLANRESSRRTKRSILLWCGYGAAALGAGMLLATFSEGGWDPHVAVGGGFLAGGLGSVWISDVFAGPDLNADEAESLIRRYNEHLHDRLIEPSSRGKRIDVAQSLDLAPWLVRGAGGLAVTGRF